MVNKQISRTRLILVEGRDEENFFGALLEHVKRTDIQVMAYGGKKNLRPTLKTLKLDPSWSALEALVVTRDADYPAAQSKEPAVQTAWKSVSDALSGLDLPVPLAHGQLSGADAEEGKARLPKTAIFIFPDGMSDGMLEDLCLAAVEGDVVRPCLDAYFRCLEDKGLTLAPNVLPKARAHAFLASRATPDKRVGEAALEGYWPWGAVAFAPLLALVRNL